MTSIISRPAAIVVSVAAFLFVLAPAGIACTRMLPMSADELFAADLIVRAKAVSYARPIPIEVEAYGETDAEIKFKLWTTGVPETQVEFKVDEVLRGEKVPETILLNGYLSKADDYNDKKPPYSFVRKNGRSGSCFANTYKQGASFLLFLKRTDSGYTPNISALGPVNEQLRGEDDEWLLWTRREVEARKSN